VKKVVFLNNWGESSQNLLKRYSIQTPLNSGKWKNIVGVDSIEKADYYVVMDGVGEQVLNKLNWEKIIYLQREPKNIKPPFKNHNFPNNLFFNGSYENFYNVPTWWINVPFDLLKRMPYPQKNKKISSVTSGKHGMKEYNDRIDFLKKFYNQYKNLEVYGRGTDRHLGNAWKGELQYNNNCKLKGHLDYEYSIVLENTSEANSWTEKPADCILSWSFPIYWGDINYEKYFPKESFYKIDYETTKIEDLVNFIEQPLSNIQMESLKEARDLLLYKWNIWDALYRIINDK